MSVCSSNLRTLSRSRYSKSLTPFLYHTATIQQWQSPVHSIGRRTAASRSRSDDDIPFEDETLPPSLDDSKANRQTTITGSERAAFEKLYKKFNAPPKSRAYPNDETDQVADEYYEEDEDEDSSAQLLDDVFDSILTRPSKRTSSRTVPQRKHHDEIISLAKDIMRPQVNKEKRKSQKDVHIKAAKFKQMQNDEKMRVRTLLENATTDRELWQVLEKEVYEPMRQLNLDATPTQQSRSNRSSKDKGSKKEKTDTPTETVHRPNISLTDPRILYPTFPRHLVAAAQAYQTNFPSSPLVFNIIPTLKSLGRSTYALGATTQLYKTIIRITWIQQHSYTRICSLLQDMDNGGIECSTAIVGVLDSIHHEYRLARSGKLGRTMQIVMGMPYYEDGIKKVMAWRELFARRLGAWGEKRLNQGQLVRRVAPGSPSIRTVTPAYNKPKDELQMPNATSNPASRLAPSDDIPFVGIETSTLPEVETEPTAEVLGQESQVLESNQEVHKQPGQVEVVGQEDRTVELSQEVQKQPEQKRSEEELLQ